MKFRELQEKYGDCEIADIEKLKSLLEEPKKPKTVWDLEAGDTFYWLSGMVDMWEESDEDSLELRECGNVFLTFEEAMKELERRKIETLLRKHAGGHEFDFGKDNFYIFPETGGGRVCIRNEFYRKHGGEVYFASYEDAKNAVQEIGEYRLIEDYFQIEKE